jgi:hypothetical protein
MNEDTEIRALALPDEAAFKRDFRAINRFQAIVKSQMMLNHDYGVIPGTGTKPTLLKPGAEKIAKLLGLADEYEIIDSKEDWQAGFFRYLIRCRLVHIGTGTTISMGLGECNSMESKYRWRKAQRKCPKCGAETIFRSKDGSGFFCWASKGGCGARFRADDTTITSQHEGKVENDDIYSQVNTLLKMAKKRSLVDAALSAGRLSDIFTQDIEDLSDAPAVEPDEPQAEPTPTSKASAPNGDKSQFWTWAHGQGFDNKGVLALLTKEAGRTIKTIDEWLADHTLDQARVVVASELLPKDAPTGAML